MKDMLRVICVSFHEFASNLLSSVLLSSVQQAIMVCTLLAPMSYVMASDSSTKSAEAALSKIQQLVMRQRSLEREYRFKEAEKVNAEAIEVAKHSKLPQHFIRRIVALHRTYELLAGVTKDQQAEYLAFQNYCTAAGELVTNGNHQGAFDVHSKGLKIIKRLLPENDILRLAAEVDDVRLRAQIEHSDKLLTDIATLKSRCLTLLGSDEGSFVILLNSEIIIQEKRRDWGAMMRRCEELDKSLVSIGEGPQIIAGNFQRMALAQLKLGKLDSAWESTQKAIVSVEKYEGLDKKQFYFWIFATGGRILMAKKDFPQAETYFRKAREAASVYQEGVFPEDYMRNFRDTYAECLVKLGKRDEADKLKVEGAFP